MSKLTATKKVLAWGNSFGIRLNRSELALLGVQPGDSVTFEAEPLRKPIDWEQVATLGGDWPKNASERLDELAYEAWRESNR